MVVGQVVAAARLLQSTVRPQQHSRMGGVKPVRTYTLLHTSAVHAHTHFNLNVLESTARMFLKIPRSPTGCGS